MTNRVKGLAWVAIAAVLVVALAIGASKSPPAQTGAQRAAAIDAELRCPSCDGISVANSSASTAQAIKAVVAAKVRAGVSTTEIESFLESRYGQQILLSPPVRGGTATVWLVPIVAVVVASALLAVFFWRRRNAVAPVAVSDHDRLLVQEALERVPSDGSVQEVASVTSREQG